ncbi:unnamed protein product [Lactuca virosa]|uniref:DUF4283 domain-containing protein n=1 Tax=Lactuca virosa TaxID=75947 RepID=A0AAU9NM05_9ASTR|nr:unnamed protein product [Lactuca virosa]
MNADPPIPPDNGPHVQPKAWELRGNRSFADVVAVQVNTSPSPLFPVIELKPIERIRNWDECVLTGEVHNAQYITEISTIMHIDGNASGKVYYTGGLRILIKFNNKKEVESFYVNNSNWNRWFKWLKRGFEDDKEADRITWVRIHGVSVRFRSEANFAHIAGVFGKVLETFRVNWNVFDISSGHVCILTKARKLINGEVDIKYKNNTYKIGVVEYDRDWNSFDNNALNKQFEHYNEVYGGNDNLDSMNSMDKVSSDCDEDAISATWEDLGKNQEEPVDGEIVEEMLADKSIPSPVPTTGGGGGEDTLMAENDSSPNIHIPGNSETVGVDMTRYNQPNKSNEVSTYRPIHTIPLPGGEFGPLPQN